MTLRIGARSATQNTRQPSRVSQSQWFLCHITCVLKETITQFSYSPQPRLRKEKACSGEVRLESHFNTSEESVWREKKNQPSPWVGGIVEVVVQGIEVGLGN